jgi:hypothetical protein
MYYSPNNLLQEYPQYLITNVFYLICYIQTLMTLFLWRFSRQTFRRMYNRKQFPDGVKLHMSSPNPVRKMLSPENYVPCVNAFN